MSPRFAVAMTAFAGFFLTTPQASVADGGCVGARAAATRRGTHALRGGRHAALTEKPVERQEEFRLKFARSSP